MHIHGLRLSASVNQSSCALAVPPVYPTSDDDQTCDIGQQTAEPGTQQSHQGISLFLFLGFPLLRLPFFS